MGRPDPVVILVPVLGRPNNIRPLLGSIHAATRTPHRVLFVADIDDQQELDELNRVGADYITTRRHARYAHKINAGAAASTEPLLFSAADDLRFHRGWLEHACALLSDTIQVVGTNDLGNPRTINGDHSTHTLFTRRYIDTQGGVVDGPPGLVLCEQYPHSWVDDEFVQTAKARGVYAHAFNSHVEHLHYLWGKGEVDATYRRGATGHMVGKRLYQRRRRMWEKPR